MTSETHSISPVILVSDAKCGQYLAADTFLLPHTDYGCADLNGLSRAGCVTCRRVPLVRWDIDALVVSGFNADARARVHYGSFLQSDFASFDNVLFRIAPAEAAVLEP